MYGFICLYGNNLRQYLSCSLYIYVLLLRDTICFVSQKMSSLWNPCNCFSIVKFAGTVRMKNNFTEEGEMNCRKRLDF